MEEAERAASASAGQLRMRFVFAESFLSILTGRLIIWCLSVSELTEHFLYNKGLLDCLEEDKCLEEILAERVSPVTWLLGR